MIGYTKLFGTILDSTIWREDKETKILWITMLAMAGREGVVEASIPGLADRAKLTIPETEKALACLLAPDTYSRTKEHEGRRIQEIDGGWLILNHSKYREKMSADERREYLRRKQAERRAKLKPVNTASTPVNNCSGTSTMLSHSEAEAEAEAERSIPKGSISVASLHTSSKWRKPKLEEVKFACAKAGLPDSEANRFWDYYESNGWRVGKNPMRSWTSALANWKRNFDTQRYANSQTNRRSNPRNDGIAIGPTDYGEAAKRKLERQALEARNREASEAQGA